MAVNIGNGRHHIEAQDLSFPGKFPLTWERNFAAAILEDPPTPLGRGWANQYFCRLSYRDETYSFIGPKGTPVLFPDPGRTLEKGTTLLNEAAFFDLQLVANKFVVRRWHATGEKVTHFVFSRSRGSAAFPLQSIEDPTGQGLDLTYDANGRPTAVTQRLERRQLQLAYDRSGWLSEVTFRPGGREVRILVRYRHDSSGSLISVADAAGLEDHYEYDSRGLMIREINRDGAVFTMRYDDQGRCVHITGLDHYDEKRLKYLDAAGFVELTDSTGAVFLYRVLPTGQIEEEIDPLGASVKTTYDEQGRIATITNPVGALTSFGYDAAGNRNGATLPLGQQVQVQFNGAHLPVALVDAAGQRWERKYDASNRLVFTRDPAGGSWSYSYDRAGNLINVVSPTGARKTLSYDAVGSLIAGTDWMGHVSRYVTDDYGRLTERTDPLGFVTRFGYDPSGNLVQHQSPDGTVRRAEYDGVGNLIRYIDADGSVTRFVYGTCGRLLQKIRPDGSSNRFRWSTEPGRQTEILNERGESHRFVYDPAGHLAGEIGFDGRSVKYRYNAAGLCIAVTNGNGEEVTFDRDLMGRITARRYPDGKNDSYAFDPLGHLAAASNEEAALSFAYDVCGRLVKETQGDQWVQSDYDLMGNLITTSTSAGFTISYKLDGNSDPVEISAADQTLRMAHDARRLEVQRQFSADTALVQTFDPVGRLIEQAVQTAAPAEPALRRTYHYDRNGQVQSLDDNLWGKKSFEYDRGDRLLAVRGAGILSEEFAYDATGNLLQKRGGLALAGGEQLSYAPGNRLERRGSAVYAYDDEGRLSAKEEAPSTDGEAAWRFRWNPGGNLAEITTPAGETWSYAYDALGRRIAKRKDGTLFARFVWDCDWLIHEITEGSVTSWVFERYSHAPILRVGPEGWSPFVCDQLGTPVAMVRNGRNLLRTEQLTAWGEATGSGNGAEHSAFRFQGHYFDAESGFHYSRFRYYEPATGRFISQDPIGTHGGINLYEYASNPVNFVDPYGLSTSSDSAKLGQNLQDKGQDPQSPGDEDAHHIVMSNSQDPRMVALQNTLKNRGIDINDPRNGIWLPRNPDTRDANDPDDPRSAHKGEGLHGDAYKQYVYDKLMAGAPPPPTKQQILDRLAKLKAELANGKKFPCKK